MTTIIEVDAVADEAAAIKHLKAVSPAVLMLNKNYTHIPREFTNYKVVDINTCLVYARTDIECVPLPTAVIPGHHETQFIRIGLKSDPKMGRETGNNAPIIGLVRLAPDQNKDAFQSFIDQNVDHLQWLYPHSPLVVMGDLCITSEQEFTKMSMIPGLYLKSFIMKGSSPVSFLMSPKVKSVKLVPESNGLTVAMQAYHCRLCKLSFPDAQEALAHRTSDKHMNSWLAHLYKNNRPYLCSAKLGMRFQLTSNAFNSKTTDLNENKGVLTLTRYVGEDEGVFKVSLSNKNLEKNSLLLIRVQFIIENSSFKLSDKNNVTSPPEHRARGHKKGVLLLPGKSHDINIYVPKKYETGTYYAPMVAGFQQCQSQSQLQFMLLEFILKITNPPTKNASSFDKTMTT